MGIDCQFQATTITDVAAVAALPGVFEVFRPGAVSFCPKDRWTITTMIRWIGVAEVGEGYATGNRGPEVAALLRALRLYCTGLEYGGDNGVWFVEVTDELIAEIEHTVDQRKDPA